MSEIVITCSGGLVRSVYSDDPDTRVTMIDWDIFDRNDADDEITVPTDEVLGYLDELRQAGVTYPAINDTRLDDGRSVINVNRAEYPHEVW